MIMVWYATLSTNWITPLVLGLTIAGLFLVISAISEVRLQIAELSFWFSIMPWEVKSLPVKPMKFAGYFSALNMAFLVGASNWLTVDYALGLIWVHKWSPFFVILEILPWAVSQINILLFGKLCTPDYLPWYINSPKIDPDQDQVVHMRLFLVWYRL